MMIYKILRAVEWTEFHGNGRTAGAPVDLADGYIHFSTADQVPATLSKHFANESDLMLLACEAERFGPDLKWEPSRGGALFPHLYRALTLQDLSWSRPIVTTDNGHVAGPLA